MKLSELMEGITPDPKYSGDVTADDMVFAIDLKPTGESTTKVSEYAVLQMNIAGLDANLNPVTSEKLIFVLVSPLRRQEHRELSRLLETVMLVMRHRTIA